MTSDSIEFGVHVAQIVTAIIAVFSSLWAVWTSLKTSKSIQMRERAEAHGKRASKLEDAVSIYFASVDALQSNRGGGSTATGHRLEQYSTLGVAQRKLELLLSHNVEAEKKILAVFQIYPNGNFPRDNQKRQDLWTDLLGIIENERELGRQLREGAK